ncbi:MAG: N-formylglutamate amidohydrolase [Methanomicrobia archaeon]|nr:N-formylglutamate amidohydrolase [Methanomicrobia archaeon]
MHTRLPIMISIPHGGDSIPSAVHDRVVLTSRDIFLDADTFTRQIYNLSERVTAVIENPIARAIVDVNRAPDERPPANPDGVIKTRTALGKQVYKPEMFPEEELINDLLAHYYYPYHRNLERLINQHELRLALDCHSMLPESPPTSDKPGRRRPLICLSNRGDGQGMQTSTQGPITCPPEWLQALADAFRQVFDGNGDDRVALNAPFLGGYISQAHSLSSGIPWIQVELNRNLYLTERYFNQQTLEVSARRLEELRGMVLIVLERFLAVIETQ